MLDKSSYNGQGQRHGLWVYHHYPNNSKIRKLWYKGFYINDIDLGYWIEQENVQIYYAR